MKRYFIAMILTCALALTACTGESAEESVAPAEESVAPAEESVAPAEAEDCIEMTVTCDSVTADGRLFTICSNTDDGENLSPAIAWDAVEGANSYAVLMFDITANWMHWVVTDLPADTLSLEEGAYEKPDYVGPYPPGSTEDHVYVIEVFALANPFDAEITNDRSVNYANAVDALGMGSGNIIGRGIVETLYKNGDHNE